MDKSAKRVPPLIHHEGNIDLAVLQTPQELIAAVALDLDLHVRPRGTKCPEDIHNQGERQRDCGAQPQNVTGIRGPDRFGGLLRQGKYATGVDEKHLSLAGQAHCLPPASRNERLAQVVLKFLDLVADGGLNRVAPFGDRGEVQVIRDERKGS